MASKREMRGRMLPVDVPEWEPLLNFAPDHYRRVHPAWLLSRVLNEAPVDPIDYFVRQNYEDEDPIVRWTRSATRHRVSRERSGHVVKNCGLRFKERVGLRGDDPTWEDERVFFFGPDADGIDLEVVAFEVDLEEFTVTHAMELRDRYRAACEEARRWLRS